MWWIVGSVIVATFLFTMYSVFNVGSDADDQMFGSRQYEGDKTNEQTPRI